MTFENPWYFLLLCLVLLLKVKRIKLPIFSTQVFLSIPQTNRHYMLSQLGWVMRCLSLIFLIISLARPRSFHSVSHQTTHGIDLMLVIDTSASMAEEDFRDQHRRLNRLQVSKSVIESFITSRPFDRIGMTIFGSEAFAFVPLTLDHELLVRQLQEVSIGMAGKATAIGDAIGVAVNRMQSTKKGEGVVILLTDGANSSGKLSPQDAARAAKALGVRIYSIGLGSPNHPSGHPTSDLDEALLQDISTLTGGLYFAVQDSNGLAKVYEKIDSLEKTKLERKNSIKYEEHFQIPLFFVFLFLIIELLFSLTLWRPLP